MGSTCTRCWLQTFYVLGEPRLDPGYRICGETIVQLIAIGVDILRGAVGGGLGRTDLGFTAKSSYSSPAMRRGVYPSWGGRRHIVKYFMHVGG